MDAANDAIPKREIDSFGRLKAARPSVGVLRHGSTQYPDHISESTGIFDVALRAFHGLARP
jgi:hypothetical protein